MPQTTVAAPPRVLRLIWFAMFMSTLIYGFIIYFISSSHPQQLLGSLLRQPFTMACYGLAALSFVGGTMIWNAMRTRPLQLRLVTTLAVFEAGAVFGLVAAFFAYDWRVYVAPWTLAMIGFSRCYPSDDVIAEARMP